LKFPTIEDENGQTVGLSQARYVRFLESREPRVRRDAFKGFYSAFQGIRNTVGVTLSAAVRSHVVNARIHHYQSALEAALKPNDIPLEVYHNLIATVEANLPRMYRYMSVRKRLLGLDELHIYDLFVPLVEEVDLAVPFAEA